MDAGFGKRLVDELGVEYSSIRSLARMLGVNKEAIASKIRKGKSYKRNGHTYKLKEWTMVPVECMPENFDENTFREFEEWKSVKSLPFAHYDMKAKKSYKKFSRYAIALFSDAHIEEVVESASVLGLNEYNINIAEQRIQKYFENLASCIIEDEVKMLVFASLGDTISGFIHDELAQCNELTPLEAIYKAQSLICSGLEMLCNSLDLDKIIFVGLVGNHSRTTKKIQHANGFKMSYEWLMYKNIKDYCEAKNLDIEFHLPESEIEVLDMPDGRRFIFAHGFQIKGSGTGTVCGIYPALNRLSMKWEKTFHQDKIYIGHFHSCVSISNATVNGSIIGYNSFALTNGMTYEEPAQMYEVYDNEKGHLLTRKIYCK